MYTVPQMKLIPQTMKMSCWYASAQMLIAWRRNSRQMSESGILDPSEYPVSAALKATDKGISNAQIVQFARALGLKPVPPVSPSEQGIESWLRSYGPLWVNGKTHIVVIAGLRPGEVLVYDPAPVNNGRIEWRSLAGWYIGKSVSARDTGPDVAAVFLHSP